LEATPQFDRRNSPPCRRMGRGERGRKPSGTFIRSKRRRPEFVTSTRLSISTASVKWGEAREQYGLRADRLWKLFNFRMARDPCTIRHWAEKTNLGGKPTDQAESRDAPEPPSILHNRREAWS